MLSNWRCAVLVCMAGSVVHASEPEASSQAAVLSLPDIEVRSGLTAYQFQNLPASATVVGGERMRQGHMEVNVSDGLGGVAGIQLQNRQNHAQDLQLSSRGYGARATFGVRGIKLLVDGIPATMPDGQGSLSHIDVGSLERVEVIRGPYSALYGNAAGGVLAFETQTPAGPAVIESGVWGGSDGQQRWALKASGASHDAWAYVLSTSRFQTDGYRDHSAASRRLSNVKFTLGDEGATQWTWVLNSLRSQAQDPQGLTAEQMRSNPRQASHRSDSGDMVAQRFNTRKSVSQDQLGFTHVRPWGREGIWRVAGYAGQRDMTQYQSIPVAAQSSPGHAGGVIDMARDYAGVDVRWAHPLLGMRVPLHLTAGLSLDWMWEARRGYENFLLAADGPQLGHKGQLRRDERNVVSSVAPYAQASWQLTPMWRAEVGARWSQVSFRSSDHHVRLGNPDDSGRVEHHFWQPVGSVSYQPTQAQHWYVSAGRGHETPTLNELSYRPDGQTGLNLALRPSESDQWELGWRRRFTGAINGQWSLAWFQARTHNEIISAGSANGRTTYRNAGETQRRGWEFGGQWKMGREWSGEWAYTHLDAAMRAQSGRVVRLPGVAEQSAYLALHQQPDAHWQWGASIEHLGKIAADDLNTSWASSYTVVSLNASHRQSWGKWQIHSSLRINNLFDRAYAGSLIVNESNGRYLEPAPGRNMVLALSLQRTLD